MKTVLFTILLFVGIHTVADYGLMAGIGVYLVGNLALHMQYAYGLPTRNIMLGDRPMSVKNRECSIVLSYLF